MDLEVNQISQIIDIEMDMAIDANDFMANVGSNGLVRNS